LTAAGHPPVFAPRKRQQKVVARSKLAANAKKTMNTQEQPKKVEPVTVDEKLRDIRKRLGRIEMHLIAIRGPRPVKKEQ
jgi:hypothetical protein